MAEQEASGIRWRDLPCGRFGETVDLLKRAVKAVEDAIKLHAHLKGHCPAGRIIRRRGRAARIWNVVRMILRLEHIEDVRTEGLRALHHVRACRISFAVDLKSARRAMNGDAGLDEDVDKLGRGQKVRSEERR